MVHATFPSLWQLIMLPRLYQVVLAIAALNFQHVYCGWEQGAIESLAKHRNPGLPLVYDNGPNIQGNADTFPEMCAKLPLSWIKQPESKLIAGSIIEANNPVDQRLASNCEEAVDVALKTFCNLAQLPYKSLYTNASPKKNFQHAVNKKQFELGNLMQFDNDGEIWSVTEIETERKTQFSMKVEPAPGSRLKREYETMLQLNRGGGECIPKVEEGSYGKYNCDNSFLFEHLTVTLEQAYNACGHRWSDPTIAYVFMQLVKCVEHIHKQGYLHNKLSMKNFMIDGDRILAVNFWSSTNYKDGESVPKKERGHANYRSKDVMAGKEPTPKDEVASLAYLLFEVTHSNGETIHADLVKMNVEDQVDSCSGPFKLFIERALSPCSGVLPDYDVLVQALSPLLQGFTPKQLSWREQTYTVLQDPMVHQVGLACKTLGSTFVTVFVPSKFYDILLTFMNSERRNLPALAVDKELTQEAMKLANLSANGNYKDGTALKLNPSDPDVMLFKVQDLGKLEFQLKQHHQSKSSSSYGTYRCPTVTFAGFGIHQEPISKIFHVAVIVSARDKFKMTSENGMVSTLTENNEMTNLAEKLVREMVGGKKEPFCCVRNQGMFMAKRFNYVPLPHTVGSVVHEGVYNCFEVLGKRAGNSSEFGFSFICDSYSSFVEDPLSRKKRNYELVVGVVVHSPLVNVIAYVQKERADRKLPELILDTEVLEDMDKYFENTKKHLVLTVGNHCLLQQACEASLHLWTKLDVFVIGFDINTGTEADSEVTITVKVIDPCPLLDIGVFNQGRNELFLSTLATEQIARTYDLATRFRDQNSTECQDISKDQHLSMHRYDGINTNACLKLIVAEVTGRLYQDGRASDPDISRTAFGIAITRPGSVITVVYSETFYEKLLNKINSKRGDNPLQIHQNNPQLEDEVKGWLDPNGTQITENQWSFAKENYPLGDDNRQQVFDRFVEKEVGVIPQELLDKTKKTAGFIAYVDEENAKWVICISVS